MADAERIAALAEAVAAEPGEWTTRRVSQLYRRLGYDAPYRRTSRRDLRLLARRGHLTAHDTAGRHYYLRSTTTPEEGPR